MCATSVLEATISTYTAVEVLLLSGKVLELALHVLREEEASPGSAHRLTHTAAAAHEIAVALDWQQQGTA